MRRLRTILWGALFSALIGPGVASACSVCMGNRDSALVKGAEAGVFLMVLVTYTVLLSFAGLTAFWVVRSRRAAASRVAK